MTKTRRAQYAWNALIDELKYGGLPFNDVVLKTEWVEPEPPSETCPSCGHDQFKVRAVSDYICVFCTWEGLRDNLIAPQDVLGAPYSDAKGVSRG